MQHVQHVQNVQNVQQHQHRIHRVTGKSAESVLKKWTRNLCPSTYLCSLPVEPLMQHEQQCHSWMLVRVRLFIFLSAVHFLQLLKWNNPLDTNRILLDNWYKWCTGTLQRGLEIATHSMLRDPNWPSIGTAICTHFGIGRKSSPVLTGGWTCWGHSEHRAVPSCLFSILSFIVAACSRHPAIPPSLIFQPPLEDLATSSVPVQPPPFSARSPILAWHSAPKSLLKLVWHALNPFESYPVLFSSSHPLILLSSHPFIPQSRLIPSFVPWHAMTNLSIVTVLWWCRLDLENVRSMWVVRAIEFRA